MKKLLYTILALISLASCDRSNDVELLLGGTPAERISDTLSYVKSALVDAPNGWIGYTTTDRRGGYGFYFEFGENDRVKMLADINDNTAGTAKESTYRVRQIMSATLVFDTYNYITMLQDPTPGTMNGTAGVGIGSDVEYEYLRTSGDTLFFKGRKFDKDFVLVKASVEEQGKYLDGEYTSSIQEINDYLTERVNTIELNGFISEFSIDQIAKKISFVGRKEGELHVTSIPYYYKLDHQLGFKSDAFTHDGVLFRGIIEENGTYYVTSSDDQKYKITLLESNVYTPVDLFGITILNLNQVGPRTHSGQLPMSSWSEAYSTQWQHYITRSKNGGYNLDVQNTSYEIVNARNEIKVVTEIFQGNSRFLANYTFPYSYDRESGDFIFSEPEDINGNASIIIPYMKESEGFMNILTSSTFKLSFVKDPVFGNSIRFTSQEDPEYYFTWQY